MKPYYQDNNVTIYNADAREILPTLSDVDMVFTSPPYNLGTCNGGPSGMGPNSLAAKSLANGYLSYSDDMPQEEYDRWQKETVSMLWNTLSETGAIFYNHKPRIQNGEAILPIIYGEGLPLRQIIIWDRSTGMNFSSRFFLPKHEWIVVWAKKDWSLKDKSASQVGDVWRIAPESADAHPAPFPITLPATAIGATDAELILDPFSGSGTTLRAAKDANLKAIGVELDERYCQIAAERCSQEVLDFT